MSDLERCPECKGVLQHREGCGLLPPWPLPFSKPAPSPQPEMPEGLQLTEEEQDWFRDNGYGSNAGLGQVKHLIKQLRVIAPLLSRAGLHIIDAKQKAVLDAMAAVPDIQIDMTLDLREDLSIQETRVWEAELEVRRAARRKP